MAGPRNLFDAGNSSLALAEIHQCIDDRWPGIVDVVDLFDHQTLAEVAVFLEGKLGEGGKPQRPGAKAQRMIEAGASRLR